MTAIQSHDVIIKNLSGTKNVIQYKIINLVRYTKKRIDLITSKITTSLDHKISPKVWEIDILVEHPERYGETDIHSWFGLMTEEYHKILDMIRKIYNDSNSSVGRLWLGATEALAVKIDYMWSIVGKYGGKALEKTVEGLTAVWKAIKRNASNLTLKINELWNKTTGKIGQVMDWVKSKLSKLWSDTVKNINAVIDWVKNQLTPIWESIKYWVTWGKDQILKLTDKITEKIVDVKNWVVELVAKKWTELKQWYTDKIQPIIDKIKESIVDLWEDTKDFVNDLIDKIGSLNIAGIQNITRGIELITGYIAEPGKIRQSVLSGMDKEFDKFQKILANIVVKVLYI